jgi:Flp pilus assembly pilin Flp
MYQYAKSLVKRFAGEKDGAALAEYALLAGLIAIVSIGTITALGGEISDAFQSLQTAISDASIGDTAPSSP